MQQRRNGHGNYRPGDGIGSDQILGEFFVDMNDSIEWLFQDFKINLEIIQIFKSVEQKPEIRTSNRFGNDAVIPVIGAARHVWYPVAMTNTMWSPEEPPFGDDSLFQPGDPGGQSEAHQATSADGAPAAPGSLEGTLSDHWTRASARSAYSLWGHHFKF